MRSRAAELAALAVLLSPALASAHEIGLSYGTYRIEDGALLADLTFAEKELQALFALDTDRDGILSGAEIDASKPVLEAKLVPLVRVAAGDDCSGAIERVERVENDGLRSLVRYRCSAPISLASVELAFLEAVEPGHRHLVQAKSAGSALELVARRGHADFKLAAEGTAAPEQSHGAVSDLFVLGIEHILVGIDHLLFLLALILVGGQLRTLVGVITAFTLAHSVTLGLAVLGIWSPSGSVIEPAIALSVAYVAIENWFVQDAKHRWRIAFAFGLLHGFGFAGALGELSVSAAQVPLALLLFNLGVEVGQLGVLAVILPPILLLRRKEGFRVLGVRAISVGIALIGVYWFVTRVYEAVV